MAGYIGDIPAFYDRDLGPVIFDHYAADVARRAAAGSPADVLEIAAGSGVVTRRLRDALAKDAFLTATDISAAMLDVARAKFAPKDKVTFQIADAVALPFANEAFDAVVCQFGFMFFSDKEAAIREAHRTLRRGGRYFLSVWDAARYNPFSRLGLEAATRFFPTDPPRFLDAPVSCAAIDPTKEALIGAGFREIVVSVLPWTHDLEDASAFARGLVFGSPFIDEINARGGVDPEEVVAFLAEALKREYGSSPTRYPMQAILFEARKA
jgi:ubiquinone/menaquinone biosynthesis C-methylase UbiE